MYTVFKPNKSDILKTKKKLKNLRDNVVDDIIMHAITTRNMHSE